MSSNFKSTSIFLDISKKSCNSLLKINLICSVEIKTYLPNNIPHVLNRLVWNYDAKKLELLNPFGYNIFTPSFSTLDGSKRAKYGGSETDWRSHLCENKGWIECMIIVKCPMFDFS